MANKNDSSQMKACLTDQTMASDLEAGSSQDTTDGSTSKRRHSESFSSETSNSRQRPGAEAHSGDVCGEGKLKREPECHMELEELAASRNHTVLIDVNQFKHYGRICPYKGKHSWDSFHVKLPQTFPKNHPMESRWSNTERALEKLMNGYPSAKDVEHAIIAYNHSHRREWRFDCLHRYEKSLPEQENNFSLVIAKMAKLALRLPELIQHNIPLLRQNNKHAITMSQEQISCLLANAFFCTFPHRNANHFRSEYGNYPSINFSSLFADWCPRKYHKLRALFHYFNTVTDEDTKPNGLVTFERICIYPTECPDWKTRNETLTNVHVYSRGLIEKEGKGMLQVDFAAKMIGGGVLGRGLVQEEIRFIQCPELIVARLFTEKLADNECLKITGVQMYSNTIGYSDNFEWLGPHHDNIKRDKWKRRFCHIVAIDALNFNDPREQFDDKNIKRELLKAYVGFRKDENVPNEYTSAIATGNWGCGAFKGDPMLKALIQMMSAAVAQRDLAYFTFDNEKQAEELQSMYKLLKCQKMTVGKLYHLLQDYCKHNRCSHKPKNVFDFIREKINVQSSL